MNYWILISRVLGEVAVKADDCDRDREHGGVAGSVIYPVGSDDGVLHTLELVLIGLGVGSKADLVAAAAHSLPNLLAELLVKDVLDCDVGKRLDTDPGADLVDKLHSLILIAKTILGLGGEEEHVSITEDHAVGVEVVLTGCGGVILILLDTHASPLDKVQSPRVAVVVGGEVVAGLITDIDSLRILILGNTCVHDDTID